MLDPEWIRQHAEEFDLFHLHFGFDAVPVHALDAIVQSLRAHRKPFVYTVHDLRNPHHPDPAVHNAQLDVLVPAADAVITLTPGAARVITERWHREVTVLPHPHVVEAGWFARRPSRAPEDAFVVGVHAKSLRPNMDVLPVVETLARTVADLPDARLRVNLHDEVFDPGSHWYAPESGALLLKYGRRPRVTVDVHRYYSDAELFSYLASLSVSVLPYRFGTHSGWLEACTDLGTQVIAPSCGFYAGQQDCDEFVFDETRFDPSTLVAALHDTYRRRGSVPPITWERRLSERRHLARAHRVLYERALG